MIYGLDVPTTFGYTLCSYKSQQITERNMAESQEASE